jgi:hypothetical protein
MTTWTLQDIAELEKSIASGATTVKYRDHQVSYRSLDEMIRLLNAMRQAVQPIASTGHAGGRSIAVARFIGRGGSNLGYGFRADC